MGGRRKAVSTAEIWSGGNRAIREGSDRFMGKSQERKGED